MTLKKLFADAKSYMTTDMSEEPLKQLYNRIRRKAPDLLTVEKLDKDAVKRIREIISEVVHAAAFEDQLRYVQTINHLFATEGFSFEGQGYICSQVFRNDAIATQVRLLKYLQGGEEPDDTVKRTRKNIAEAFGMNETALDHHLTDLQNGTDILGSKVSIELRRGENNYDSTVHPVFLALNLSEVYLLTVAMKQKMGSCMNEVIADIYRQLSPYAKQKIDQFAQRDDVDLFDGKPLSDFERGYRKEGKDFWGYLEKSGDACEICFEDEFPLKRTGHIKSACFVSEDQNYTRSVTDESSIYSLKNLEYPQKDS